MYVSATGRRCLTSSVRVRKGEGRDGQGGEMIQREDAMPRGGEWVREVTAAGREISVL